MFLAFREIVRNKKHFALIAAVITLVGILVFFLSGLAVGLRSAMSSAAADLKATQIALSKDSNDAVQASIIPLADTEKVTADDKSLLGLSGVTIQESADEQISTFVFAMEDDAFTLPEVIEGRGFQSAGEVVADESIKLDGINLGDTFELTQSDQKFKVVGFTTGKTYSAAPVLYMSLDDWRTTGVQFKDAVSAVALRGNVDPDSLKEANLTVQTLDQFVNAIPGVSAQDTTFALMIGALIVIASVVLGVFIYVLTLQKRKVFGVMKAQGIGNFTIGMSVLWQTALLSIFGSVLAVAITLTTAAFMPQQVPFTVPWLLFGLIGAVMVVFSLLGALFSVLSATRIDPLIAIK